MNDVGFKGGNIPAWIHDDITWCMDESCPVVSCMRNTKNMMDRSGPHSYAMMKDTEDCPIYQMERNAAIERGDES